MKTMHNVSVPGDGRAEKSDVIDQPKEYTTPEVIRYGGIAELVLMNFGENVVDGSPTGKPIANS